MAPEGKTSAIVMIESRNLAFWSGLRDTDPARYREEKRKVGELVVEALEAELGGIQPFVEVVDVATPATWHRYTGNWQGSYEGFLPTRKTMMKTLGFTLPGLAQLLHARPVGGRGRWPAPRGHERPGTGQDPLQEVREEVHRYRVIRGRRVADRLTPPSR